MHLPHSIRQRILLITIIILTGVSFAFSQEVEPNDSCLSAQNVGAVSFPLSLNGSIDTRPGMRDIDFFLFRGTPDEPVQIDAIGFSRIDGFLTDPLLAAFDAGCSQRLAFDDDSGSGFNSRIGMRLPADGALVLGVASFDDEVFPSQPNSGSYQLTIVPVVPAQAVRGRVVDASTGAPLPGSSFPFTIVDLFSCTDPLCNEINFVISEFPDSEGRFTISETAEGHFLLPGTYLLIASAFDYDFVMTEPFSLGPDEDLDIGDIELAFVLTPTATMGLPGDLRNSKKQYSYNMLRDMQHNRFTSE